MNSKHLDHQKYNCFVVIYVQDQEWEVIDPQRTSSKERINEDRPSSSHNTPEKKSTRTNEKSVASTRRDTSTERGNSDIPKTFTY